MTDTTPLAAAPVTDRVTLDRLDAAIASVDYHVFPGSQLTVCCLTLQNGFTVTGQSACASPENFDAEIGRRIAFDKARNEIWQLEGYLLKERMRQVVDYPATREYVTAMLCHEVNRLWCAMHGDLSQPAWHEAPSWQAESALDGVAFHAGDPNASASASHENWLEGKVSAGWTYGPEKDEAKKTHPCIVPFHELPPMQQTKDRLFKAIVHAVMGSEPLPEWQGEDDDLTLDDYVRGTILSSTNRGDASHALLQLRDRVIASIQDLASRKGMLLTTIEIEAVHRQADDHLPDFLFGTTTKGTFKDGSTLWHQSFQIVDAMLTPERTMDDIALEVADGHVGGILDNNGAVVTE